MTDRLPARAFDDAGFSLVEILVAIAILGIAIVTLMGGLATAINASDRHEAQAQVETVLHAAIENVKDPVGLPHVDCATATQSSYVNAAQSAATLAGTPAPTVQITAIAYWDGSGFGSTCYDDPAHEYLALQRIMIAVTSATGRADMTLAFVKGCNGRDSSVGTNHGRCL